VITCFPLVILSFFPENQQYISENTAESFPKIPSEFTQYSIPEKEDGHLLILQNFAQAVLNGTPLLAPGYDGINELSISNAAYLSQWLDNAAVELPMDEKLFNKLLQERIDKSVYKMQTHTTLQSGEYSSRWNVNW